MRGRRMQTEVPQGPPSARRPVSVGNARTGCQAPGEGLRTALASERSSYSRASLKSEVLARDQVLRNDRSTKVADLDRRSFPLKEMPAAKPERGLTTGLSVERQP